MAFAEGNQVRIHAFDPDAMDPVCSGRLFDLLDEGERERLHRFRHEPSARQFLAAHGLLRLVLAQRLGCAPADCRFLRAPAGKPFLDPARHPGGPPFSLTHTGSLVAVAVGPPELGLDAERLDPRLDAAVLVKEILAGPELAGWRSLPADQQLRGCYRLWALKEAVLKGTGLGLGCPPRELCFALDPPRLLQAPAAIPDPAAWSFAEPDLGPEHACALAVRGRSALTVTRLDAAGLFRPLA